MGIVNVTPESAFGGHSDDPTDAIDLGRRLIADGADLLDVSGVRKSGGLDDGIEAERVLPVVRALAEEIPVSIGTTSQATAEAAVEAGASAISDQSGDLYPVAALHGVGWIVLHRPGGRAAALDGAGATAQTVSELTDAARTARDAGVEKVWIDPGLGFDRSPDQSLALLANIGELVATGYPVLVSASRKRFLGVDPESSIAAATWAMAAGAALVRVHDVAATVQARSVIGGKPLVVAVS
jgi:dihydropteroate synthase